MITVFAESMLAEKPMAAPFSSSTFRVRIEERSASAIASAELFLVIASAKVRVMFLPGLFITRPFGGLNTGAGGVVSPCAMTLTRI